MHNRWLNSANFSYSSNQASIFIGTISGGSALELWIAGAIEISVSFNCKSNLAPMRRVLPVDGLIGTAPGLRCLVQETIRLSSIVLDLAVHLITHVLGTPVCHTTANIIITIQIKGSWLSDPYPDLYRPRCGQTHLNWLLLTGPNRRADA